MENHKHFEEGTSNYVFYHGLSMIKKGKKPTALLIGYYTESKDPEVSFELATFLVRGSKVEETSKTAYGKPFLRSQIDWAERYVAHQKGPSSHIDFQPKSGVDNCACSECFYRNAPKEDNPQVDCQIGKKGDLAKKFFGTNSTQVLPQTFEGRQLGHYCPFWLHFSAE